jgi:cytidylate kinase
MPSHEYELFATARRPTIVATERKPRVKTPEVKPLRRHLTRAEVLGAPEDPTSITIVTIGGKSYTGKTSAGQKVSGRLDFDRENVFFVGDFMREQKHAGRGAQGAMTEDEELDKKSDKLQCKIARRANAASPGFLESRLAAPMVKRFIKENPELNVNAVTVLLLAPDEIRQQRALQRTSVEIRKRISEIRKEIRELQSETNPDQILIEGARLRLRAEDYKLKNLDIEELWNEELQREKNDQASYRRMYPWLKGYEKDYMDPELTDEYGNRVYDIVVDTGGKTQEETYDEICQKIRDLREERKAYRTIVNTIGESETVYVANPIEPEHTLPC